MNELLSKISLTTGGLLVRDLRYLPVDNIIVGLVQDTEYGSPVRDYMIAVQWTKQGKPIKVNKGRKNLEISI